MLLIPHYAYTKPLGHMQKKATDTLKITSNDRLNIKQTDFTTGLTRLDQQCNRTGTQTTDKKEKRKSHRFAFLKISATAHYTHLQSHTSQHTAQALQKSAILPTLKTE